MHQLTEAVSLSTICEHDLLGAKDCSELALQVLGAHHRSSSGVLRGANEQLIYFQLTTRVWSSRLFPKITHHPFAFHLRLRLCSASALNECLESLSTLFHLNPNQPKHNGNYFVPFQGFASWTWIVMSDL
jgi:hypothetical protein